MSHKPIVKVSFNENTQEESSYFLKRLIEKIIMDELELPPPMKGAFLLHTKNITEKE